MPTMLLIRGNWIPSMSLRRATQHVRGDAFLHTTKIYATHHRRLHNISETRRAKHGVQPLAKTSLPSQRFHETKSGQNTSNIRRFLIASRMTKHFMQASLEHYWTDEWCTYLDYIRTIDITHNVSPEQRERYAALYHFRYSSKIYGERSYEKSSRLIMELRGRLSA